MISIDEKSSRLVTVRLGSPLDMPEITNLVSTIASLVKSGDEPRVFCTDMRRVVIFPKDIGDRLVGLMRADNSRIVKNGILVNEGTILGLQMARILREGANPARRTFQDAEVLVEYLSDSLSPVEVAHVRSFLR